jgi:hypothetical protein
MVNGAINHLNPNFLNRCFFLRLTNLLKQPDRLYFITSWLHNLLRSYEMFKLLVATLENFIT